MCAHAVDGALIARITALAEVDLDAVRCPRCGSIQLAESALDSSPDDTSIDAYIEGGAGIGTIAAGLHQVDPTTVRRFLDVGSNYGFALDVGRHLHGWEVVGVEPSLAGRRGAAELDLDIRNEYLNPGSDIGADFDLVLASEVVEHVEDPLGFLRMLGARLTPSGTLILTTPAAEIFAPDSPESDALIAASPGYHVFIASRDGLEQLLRRAGFATVQVVRERGTLRAAASHDPRARFDAEPETAPEQLEDYYRHRAETSAVSSALATGMATRYLRSLVSRGAFDQAEVAVPLVVRSMRARHDIDLADPRAATAGLADRVVPCHLAGAAFALGMLELIHRGRPADAADYFALVAGAVDGWQRRAELLDLDSVDLRFQAEVHRAIALARFDPDAAVPVAANLARFLDPAGPNAARVVATRQSRIHVELVARGNLAAAQKLVDELGVDSAHELARSEDPVARSAGLDSLFSLGITSLNTGDPVQARFWFTLCAQLCADDSAGHTLRTLCLDHIGIAAAHGAIEESVVPIYLPPARLHHAVDVYWCDARGTFLEGWAHAESVPVRRFGLTVGDTTVTRDPLPSPDLASYWPGLPVERCGFSAYVEAAPTGRVTLTLHTDSGDYRVEIDLPARELPELTGFQLPVEGDAAIRAALAGAPYGPVLTVGMRSASEEILADRLQMFGNRELVNIDIHPGIGVDIVGDAHRLSQLVEPGRFAIVASASLLEHVTAPWLVAAEFARVLMPGGFAVQVAPWMWPTHAEPNDFWRFSAEGLALLFGPSLGFRTVALGSSGGATVVPMADWRETAVKMPTTSSAASSWIVAEKVDNSADTVRWPYDEYGGGERARRYPVGGLSTQVSPS